MNCSETIYDVIIFNDNKLYIDNKLKIIYDKNKKIINTYKNYDTIGKDENEILNYFIKNNILQESHIIHKI